MRDIDIQFVHPEWPAPPVVHAAVTTRLGGVSVGPFASLNLGAFCGDDPIAVSNNRCRTAVALNLPTPPCWLTQVHGCQVVHLPRFDAPQADAAWTDRRDTVCAILTADCLPVLLCDRSGSIVAAVHAGWRGLAQGVLEAAIRAMPVRTAELLAWLGPAIGPQSFEVGREVRSLFVERQAEAASAFVPVPRRPGIFLADLYALARLRLATAGVFAVFGGDFCTFSNVQSFYSYRRDGRTGRMASMIWRS